MLDNGKSGSAKFLEGIGRWFAVPALTRTRVWFALGVAVVTDTVQLALGPAGWVLADQSLDVVAMVLTSAAIGFHPLLLPTFILEFLPVTDMLPTWTGCVGAVLLLRRNSQPQPRPPSPPPRINEPPLLPPPDKHP